jgi:nucleolar MIF4G domain-containing protein 1
VGGETLHVTWEDLRACEERGRWWRVGASWSGKGKGKEKVEEGKEMVGMGGAGGCGGGGGGGAEESLQERMARLAAKQRMNTDVRRAVFCAIMAAADYEDAFERLMRLNLRCVAVGGWMGGWMVGVV